MTRMEFEAIVAEAMLAPSAHNTQPVRWALGAGTIELFADLTRRLPVGDPDDRDLKIACGAAVEGTVLALARRGFGADVIWLDGIDDGHLRPAATVTPHGKAHAQDVLLAEHAARRITHRCGFAQVEGGVWQGLDMACITLVTQRDQVAWLAARVDQASATILRDRAFRDELLHWMRLNQGGAGYDEDGLNKEALAMDAVTAWLTKPVLGTRVYDLLSGLGLGPALSGERKRTSQAGGVALFHWPIAGSLFEAGQAFYRFWLEATARGLVGWPAAALADDPATSAVVSERFLVPKDRVLMNAIRLGAAEGETPKRTRLPVCDVII